MKSHSVNLPAFPFKSLMIGSLISFAIISDNWPAFAQNTEYFDSLEQVVNTLPEDTTKVLTLIELAKIYTRKDNDKSNQFAEDVLLLSKRLSFQRGVAEGFYYKGKYEIQQGNLEVAAKLYVQAKEIFSEVNDPEGVARSLNNLGSIQLRLGEMDAAQAIYLEALQILKKLPDSEKDQAVTLNRIGNTHNNLKQFDKALEYYTASLKLVEELNYMPGIFSNLNNIGTIYSKTGEYEKANEYLEKAYLLSKNHSDVQGIAVYSSNLGSNYSEMGEYQKAVEYQLVALEYFQQMKNEEGIHTVMTNLGDNYMQLGQYATALEFTQKGLEFSQSSNNKELIVANLRTLAQIYVGQGQYENGYKYLMEHVAMSDSVYSDEIANITAELEAKYQNELKSEEIALLESENSLKELQISKKENELLFFIILAIVAVIMLGLLYNQYRIKQKANQKLQEIDQLKSDFFTNISHEFRTPLSLVKGPLLEKVRGSHGKEKEAFDMMYRNVHQLDELINQMLDLSKLEAGKLEINTQPYDIHHFLRLATASFSSQAESKHIHFTTRFMDSPCWLEFDRDVLQKVTNNLLSNAFKFTPENGTIRVSAAWKAPLFQLIVEDSGPGIPESDRNKVFDRFHHTRNSQGGTGIGLALIKELTERIGGNITVRRSELGGAYFKVTLPLKVGSTGDINDAVIEQAAAEDMKKTGATSPDINDSQPHILVIEDNEDLRKYLVELLSDEYNVSLAKDGNQGVEMVTNIIPDLVISDIMMPGKDGMEVCRYIKESEITNHIPVILLTAKADQDSKLEGLGFHADDYIVKPFDPKEVLLKVRNFIQRQQHLKEKYVQLIQLKPSAIEITNKEEAFIKLAIEKVEEHIENSEFTTDMLATELGMSRMQLHRKLAALTNQSATTFIKNIRLHRATDLITAGQENISQVSYAVGFSSLSYFTKSFKEKYGITPSEFQKVK